MQKRRWSRTNTYLEKQTTFLMQIQEDVDSPKTYLVNDSEIASLCYLAVLCTTLVRPKVFEKPFGETKKPTDWQLAQRIFYCWGIEVVSITNLKFFRKT